MHALTRQETNFKDLKQKIASNIHLSIAGNIMKTRSRNVVEISSGGASESEVGLWAMEQ